MKVERRNFLLLLGCLMLVLSLTLALTMQLERSPQMQRNTNGVQTAKDKQINLQEVMDSAIDMMSRGNFSAAEAVLADAVKQYPGQSDLWMLLGEAYYRQEKFAQAEQTFRHLLRYQPENAAGYNNLAESLIKLERFQEAQTAINQAIQLAPKNGEILLNAASLYAQQQDDQLALYYLKQALDCGIQPETVSNYKELVRLLERPDFMNYYRKKTQERNRRHSK